MDQVADYLTDIESLTFSVEKINMLLIIIFSCYVTSIEVILTHCMRRVPLHRWLLKQLISNLTLRLHRPNDQYSSCLDTGTLEMRHVSLGYRLRRADVLPMCLSPLSLALELVSAGLYVEGINLLFNGNMIGGFPTSSYADMIPRLRKFLDSETIPTSYEVMNEAQSATWGWQRYRELCRKAKRLLIV